ncbi:MAG TPA: ABATE domain-containing protein, partial [Solirubrobacteraceae bacterium]|nr:ABATE domain-containing protein [Solirubrobacteraceae bacterium]
MEREVLLAADFQPGGRPPAPPPLDLVQAFVNTVDREHGPDLLDDEAGLAEWLARRDLAADAVRPADLRRAREVREALREVLWANTHGRDPAPGAPAALDAAA